MNRIDTKIPNTILTLSIIIAPIIPLATTSPLWHIAPISLIAVAIILYSSAKEKAFEESVAEKINDSITHKFKHAIDESRKKAEAIEVAIDEILSIENKKARQPYQQPNPVVIETAEINKIKGDKFEQQISALFKMVEARLNNTKNNWRIKTILYGYEHGKDDHKVDIYGSIEDNRNNFTVPFQIQAKSWNIKNKNFTITKKYVRQFIEQSDIQHKKNFTSLNLPSPYPPLKILMVSSINSVDEEALEFIKEQKNNSLILLQYLPFTEDFDGVGDRTSYYEKLIEQSNSEDKDFKPTSTKNNTRNKIISTLLKELTFQIAYEFKQQYPT